MGGLYCGACCAVVKKALTLYDLTCTFWATGEDPEICLGGVPNENK